MIDMLSSLLCMFWNFSFCKQEIMLPSQQANTETIIIVWAGISWLVAAKELHHAGKNVVVLEAKEKIWGRIDTQTQSGMSFELGASWIHGDQKNPVADILKKEGNTLILTDFDNSTQHINGKESEEDEDAEDFFEYAYEQIETLEDDISLAKCLQNYIKKYKIAGAEKEYLLYRVKIDMETEYGTSLQNISLFSLDAGKEMKGGDKLVQGGYEKVIQYLAKDIDIRLGTPVSTIVQTQTWVLVSDTSGNTFSGSKVILTVPLGVLKKWYISFEPVLSTEKLQAISSLGMGNFHKTFLVFDKSFWDDTTVIDIFDTDIENSSLWGEFFNLETLMGKPVLLVLHGGEAALEIEKKDTETLKKEVFEVLRSVYPQAQIPKKVISSEWHKDEFTQGSYSYLPLWGEELLYDLLAKPEGKVYFAGEHTSKDFPSTTHGAYLSGIRAAQEILDSK